MIKFNVDDQVYRIEWRDEPYQQLYMFYEPQGKLFLYEGQKIKTLTQSEVEQVKLFYVSAPRVATAIVSRHYNKLPIGRYRCALYGDVGRTGEPLRYEYVFIGKPIDIVMSRQAFKSGFDIVSVESAFMFPKNSICLTFMNSLGEKIMLPEMRRKEESHYYTQCILPPEAFQYLTVKVSSDIADCVRIRKE